MWKNTTVRVGVNNVFDRDPPIVDSANSSTGSFTNGNTQPQVYDALGRKFFTSLTMTF